MSQAAIDDWLEPTQPKPRDEAETIVWPKPREVPPRVATVKALEELATFDSLEAFSRSRFSSRLQESLPARYG